MCIKTTYYIIQQIDNQLSTLNVNQKDEFSCLMQLRNNIIASIFACSNEETNNYFWEITNQKIKKLMSTFDWKLVFINK
jgi:hypothetical protein